MGIKLKPVKGRLIVEPIKPETQTKGGIILPDVAKVDQDLGRVVLLGEGVPSDWQGRIVLYMSYAGQPFQSDGQTFILIDQEDVLAVSEETETGETS